MAEQAVPDCAKVEQEPTGQPAPLHWDPLPALFGVLDVAFGLGAVGASGAPALACFSA